MRVERQYEKLTIDERFALSVEAFARKDVVEIDRLQDTLPVVTYKGGDMRYWRRLQVFNSLVMSYGLWRNLAMKRAMLATSMIDVVEDATLVEKLTYVITKSLREVHAHDDAWETFCESIQIDPKKAQAMCYGDPTEDWESLFLEALENLSDERSEPDANTRDELISFYRERWASAASDD